MNRRRHPKSCFATMAAPGEQPHARKMIANASCRIGAMTWPPHWARQVPTGQQTELSSSQNFKGC